MGVRVAPVQREAARESTTAAGRAGAWKMCLLRGEEDAAKNQESPKGRPLMSLAE